MSAERYKVVLVKDNGDRDEVTFTSWSRRQAGIHAQSLAHASNRALESVELVVEHPFQPGTKVAVLGAYGDGTRYDVDAVDKVHKTGHFTLMSSPDKWRADTRRLYGDKAAVWYAERPSEANSRFRTTVRLLDDMFLAEVATRRAEKVRVMRAREVARQAYNIVASTRCVDAFSDWQIDELERFVNLCKDRD